MLTVGVALAADPQALAMRMTAKAIIQRVALGFMLGLRIT
jgi:hypothetical protein